jgi:hypothetical protein
MVVVVPARDLRLARLVMDVIEVGRGRSGRVEVVSG